MLTSTSFETPKMQRAKLAKRFYFCKFASGKGAFGAWVSFGTGSYVRPFLANKTWGSTAQKHIFCT